MGQIFLDELLSVAFHENATPKYKVFEAIPHNDCCADAQFYYSSDITN